jgi:hypothetical protein
MIEPSNRRSLVFSVIEDESENVSIEISEEDYQAWAIEEVKTAQNQQPSNLLWESARS